MKRNSIKEFTTLKNIEVIFEDNHLLSVNKRSSDIVQVDKTGDLSLEDIAKEYIKVKYEKPGNVFLGVTHRIDRPVSGIVLFAKTSKALARINEMFQKKEITKKYWAIVKVKPPQESGRLSNYLKRNESKNITTVYKSEIKDSKLAILDYKIIADIDGYYLLEVSLITGRHHQIRAQLGFIGCPIIGDNKYGYTRANKDLSIHLHSKTMEFAHPVTKELITINAKLPDDVIWNRFKSI